MRNMTSVGLWAVGGFILLIGAASTQFLTFDRACWNGIGIAALVGVLNIAFGSWLLKRNIARGGNPMGGVAGGFLARLVTLAVLTLTFQRLDAIDATAFALVFMMFFFLFVAVEIVMIARATNDRRVAT